MLKKRFFKTKDDCEVTFELAVEAQEASLVCEHNGWEPLDMRRLASGTFKTRVRLPKDGSYEFRYLLDGDTWVNDEAADTYRTNDYGTENGVVETIPA